MTFSKLLDTLYSEDDSKLVKETSVLDGWSSIQNDPIIASSGHIGRGF